MGANLLTMRRMVRDRLGVPPHDAFLTDTVIDSNINLSLAAFASEANWPWNEARATLTITGGGDGSVSLPTNWSATRAILLANDELDPVTIYDLERVYNNAGNGIPQVCATIGSTLHVRPIPSSDTELVIIYYKDPLFLANDLDETNVPTEHSPAIVAKACQLCSVRESERGEAQDHLLEYREAVARAKRSINRGNTRGVGRRIRPGGWV